MDCLEGMLRKGARLNDHLAQLDGGEVDKCHHQLALCDAAHKCRHV